jgi:hypothetical protein
MASFQCVEQTESLACLRLVFPGMVHNSGAKSHSHFQPHNRSPVAAAQPHLDKTFRESPRYGDHTQ